MIVADSRTVPTKISCSERGSARLQKKWAISAGTSVRQIDADFRAPAPQPLADWRTLVPPRHAGNGSQELYNNRSDREEYKDGTAFSSYEHASQVKDLGNGWYSISFHSIGSEYSSASADRDTSSFYAGLSFGIPFFNTKPGGDMVPLVFSNEKGGMDNHPAFFVPVFQSRATVLDR
ncbi:MAG: hypothetical protein OEL83_08590 [Desulforhopalus sp.]|nr:hypothetical protein [Desulforhopalus sp.]